GGTGVGAEHDRVVALAIGVELRLLGELAHAIEAELRGAFDAAVEQADGGEVARILERAAERQHAPGPAVVVLRRPVVAVARAAVDRRQRDRLAAHQPVGLQARAPAGGGARWVSGLRAEPGWRRVCEVRLSWLSE